MVRQTMHLEYPDFEEKKSIKELGVSDCELWEHCYLEVYYNQKPSLKEQSRKLLWGNGFLVKHAKFSFTLSNNFIYFTLKTKC